MSGELLAELNARLLPAWHDEAKFGIFVHGYVGHPRFRPALAA